MYFNIAPFGAQDIGIEAAVEDYFHLQPQCDQHHSEYPVSTISTAMPRTSRMRSSSLRHFKKLQPFTWACAGFPAGKYSTKSRQP